MAILLSTATSTVWQQVISQAESACSIQLDKRLESYLISLLIRYANRPEIANQIMATAYLEAMELEDRQRSYFLQQVGDQCLLFAGLYPQQAERRHVRLAYFVDIGRAAYGSISQPTNGLFGSLAIQFVLLMDVLQSIPERSVLLPLEAYEQWHELGSQRALRILKTYLK